MVTEPTGLPDDVRRMLAKAARGYLAEMRGEFCQCAEPDIEGRKATLCWTCGLVNQDAQRRVAKAMRAPHPFEPMGDDWIRSHFCGFCSYTKDDARHGGAMLWDGHCPRDGTPTALHWDPDDVDGHLIVHHWWQCKHGHTFPSEYDREAREHKRRSGRDGD